MLSEQLLHDVADLFETRKKLAERKTQDLITHQWNEQLGNEIPQEYIDFCKAWVKVQLQVNNNPEVAKKKSTRNFSAIFWLTIYVNSWVFQNLIWTRN